MSIEEIKGLYVNNNPKADIISRLWSENLFVANVNGDTLFMGNNGYKTMNLIF